MKKIHSLQHICHGIILDKELVRFVCLEFLLPFITKGGDKWLDRQSKPFPVWAGIGANYYQNFGLGYPRATMS